MSNGGSCAALLQPKSLNQIHFTIVGILRHLPDEASAETSVGREEVDLVILASAVDSSSDSIESLRSGGESSVG